MSQAAANYIDAHGYTANSHHDAAGKKGHVVSDEKSNDRVDVNHKKVFGQCGHCGMKNHKTDDCWRRPQPNRMHRTSDNLF